MQTGKALAIDMQMVIISLCEFAVNKYANCVSIKTGLVPCCSQSHKADSVFMPRLHLLSGMSITH